MPDINDLMPNTPDLNRERLEQLKRLMPDLFTADDRLDLEELKRLVDPTLVSDSEKFEFRWFGKADAKRRAFTPTTAALQYDAARSVNPDVADGNMIIEGENLEVLKCLLSAYREKIKCIYIDPPYNTGNDFVYSDNYSEQRKAYWEQTGVTEDGVKVDTNSESAGRYHSNWLNMMYPRLLAARQLLREDGVIAISIGEAELGNLLRLCNEVFGERNLITICSRVMKTGGQKGVHFSPCVDYIAVIAKNIDELGSFSEEISQNLIDKVYTKIAEDGPRVGEKYRSMGLYQAMLDTRANQRFYIECPDGELVIPPGISFPDEQSEGSQIKPQDGDGVWRWTFSRYSKEKNQQNVEFIKSDRTSLIKPDGSRASWNVYYKIWLNDRLEQGQLPGNILDKFESRHSSAELKELGIPFDFAKPTELIKFLISVCGTRDDDIILDFFAGSGTTAHAVLNLNLQDEGNRQFILVQLPEQTDIRSEEYKAGYKKISDITIERNKRVIARIAQEQAEKQQQGLFEQGQEAYQPGFKTYRLVKSHFPRVEFQPDPEKTAEENIALLKQYIIDKEATLYSLFNEADIFDEVMLKNGFQLHYTRESVAEFTANSVYRVSDGHKTALVCLDAELNDATVAALGGHVGSIAPEGAPTKAVGAGFSRDQIFICLERAVDTTKKWNLKHQLGEKLVAF